MNILYLVPLIPARSGSGGRRAVYNHLIQQFGNNTNVSLVIVDVEGHGEVLAKEISDLNPKIFPRALSRIGSGPIAWLQAIAAFLTSPLPRSVRVVRSKAVRKHVQLELQRQKFDAVVLDHLNAYGIVKGLRFDCPLIYIAHNIESIISRQSIGLHSAPSLLRVFAYIDFCRMHALEKELMRVASRIVFIASSDKQEITEKSVLDKCIVWPELPTLKTRLWNYTASKSLVFVGSSSYAPNKEAILWLQNSLMPAIALNDASVTLRIVGTSEDDLGECFVKHSNILMEGFVSDISLAGIQLSADLFISPVVLGSGIKIKVLEAASYGVPVIATSASLVGIHFLENHAFELIREPEADASRILELLKSPIKLIAASNGALLSLRDAHAERGTLETILL